jgi:hypothetical protein
MHAYGQKKKKLLFLSGAAHVLKIQALFYAFGKKKV